MLTVYSDDHRRHVGQSELVDGKLQPCFEMPSRADTVLACVKSRNLASTTFPGRRLRRDGPISTALMGELGHYSFDTEAPITAGTWQAVYSLARVALTAQDHMRQGANMAFGLCLRRVTMPAATSWAATASITPPSSARPSSTRVPGAWPSSIRPPR